MKPQKSRGSAILRRGLRLSSGARSRPTSRDCTPISISVACPNKPSSTNRLGHERCPFPITCLSRPNISPIVRRRDPGKPAFDARFQPVLCTLPSADSRSNPQLAQGRSARASGPILRARQDESRLGEATRRVQPVYQFKSASAARVGTRLHEALASRG